jgi:uncharacterized protein (TIGR02588 family)
MSADRARTGAEWVSFAVSCTVLAAIVAAIGWLWITDSSDAQVEARIVSAQNVQADQIEVTVEVRNTGDRTAIDVQIIGELATEDGPQQFGEQSIDFLTGGEAETLVFIAPTADDGSIEVRVGSYSRP